ncbi:hypothetical protein Drorol1_Dr00021423 [Drosera rotundifolia]
MMNNWSFVSLCNSNISAPRKVKHGNLPSMTFSMKRLELLGDSVLKYTMSCLLFLKYPEKHEGQLSARCSSAVCNASLCKFRTYCQLQEEVMVRKHWDKGALVDGFKSSSRLCRGSCWSLLCHWWIIRRASCYEVPGNGKRSLYYLVPLKLMILKPSKPRFNMNSRPRGFY